MNSYDLIGDIHGYADVLQSLLHQLGYEPAGKTWKHPEDRRMIFLGDFIDRGPSIRRTLQIARAMVESGNALAVMGNHEYNALLYHARGESGDFLRPHTPKNVGQHAATLAQFWDYRAEWEDYLKWFMTLPLWLDLGVFRVVHACWNDGIIAEHPDYRILTPETLHNSAQKGSSSHRLIETVLKGPEIGLPEGHAFADKDGTPRTSIRIRWWLAAHGRTYRDLSIPSSETIPALVLSDEGYRQMPHYAEDAAPVFIGHYWLPYTASPGLMSPNVACLDFSVAKGGALAAYRWDGERKLNAGKIVFSDRAA